MIRITRLFRLFGVLLLAALVAACGTDSSSGGSGSDSGGDKGFTLRLTDAPFDGSLSVEMTFVEVRLRQVGGGWISIPSSDLSTNRVVVSDLQGTKTEVLVSGLDLPPGDYDELRLVVDNDPMANKIVDSTGAEFPLTIPSGSASGLKIKGDFTISDMPTTLIADIDLRQSIRMAGPNYLMQPVVRLIKGGNFGHARGMIDGSQLIGPGCSDADADTFNAIYVFEGHDVVPADIDQSSDTDVDPITTSTFLWDGSSSSYKFEAAFLPQGEYTIALTCSADQDGLDTTDNLNFFGTRNVTIRVNDTTFL